MPGLIASVSPESLLLLRKDGLSAGNSRSVTVTCLGPAGTVRLLFQGSLPSALPFSEAQETNNYDRMMHAAVSVKCLPGFTLGVGANVPQPLAEPSSLTLDALASPRGSASVTLALLQVPTKRLTVVVTASSDDLPLVLFTSRIYFEALEQQQTRTIYLSHMGGFVNGTVVLSLAGAGGNYEGTVLRNALLVPVDTTSMLISTKSILVHPSSSQRVRYLHNQA